MTGSVKTHYDNLKVARNAPPEVIRAAYKVLAQKYHPDLNPGNADSARIMKLVNVAYDTLSDPTQRREHDAWIAEQERPDDRADEMREASVGEQMRSSYGADIPRSQQNQWRAANAPASRQVYKRPIVAAGIVLLSRAREFFRTGLNLVVSAFVVLMWLSLVILIAGVVLEKMSDIRSPATQTPTPARTPTALAPAPLKSPKYARSAVAPNGSPWPSTPGYVHGYPVANHSGRSSLTIDNRQGGSDVFVKVHALAGENEGVNVRHFYIPSGGTVRASQLSPGEYDIRYQALDDGTLTRSESFVLSETIDGDDIRYSNMTLTIYRVKNGNSKSYPLAASDF